MIIRRARIEDAADLQRSCFTALSVDQVREAMGAEHEAIHGPQFVAETHDGTVVATCNIWQHPHRMQRHRAELGGFVIRPDHRGTGLARTIVGHLADVARDLWGTTILELSVRGDSHAHRAYVGLGFVVWARLPGGLDDRGTVYDEVRLYRRI